jgi:hypothetical protein
MTWGSFLPQATHASCSGRAQRQTAPAESDAIVALSSPQDAYSADFAAQTTPEINAAVDARYGVNTYASNFIKKSCTPMALRGPGRGRLPVCLAHAAALPVRLSTMGLVLVVA